MEKDEINPFIRYVISIKDVEKRGGEGRNVRGVNPPVGADKEVIN